MVRLNFKHQSVLLEETIDNLNIQPDGIYVDGTLGGGGHAFQVCSRLSEKGHFIGIDQDAAAIEAAGERLRPFGDKVTIVRSNYSDMKQVFQGKWHCSGFGCILLSAGHSRAGIQLQRECTAGHAYGPAAGEDGQGHCQWLQ